MNKIRIEENSAGEKKNHSLGDVGTKSVSKSLVFSILESLLFSSDKPVGLAAFKQVFEDTPVDIKDIKKALEELKSFYQDSSRGVSLEEINGGWQLRTKVENREFLKKLTRPKAFRLSGPALEVLSIVAYRQPIIKSEVDRVRGVESGHLMRSLMEKKLISFQGKSDLPGKPLQYGTTAKFLEVFGLKNLKGLPSLEDMDQLLPDGMGGEDQTDAKLSDIITDEMFLTHGDSDLYGEKELMNIGKTLKKIKTMPNLPEPSLPEEEKPEENNTCKN